MQKCDCSLYEFVVSTDACVVWCAIVYKKLTKEVLSDCTVIISMRLNTVATGPTSIHKHTHTYTLTQTQLNTHAAVILRVQCGVHKAIFVYTLFLLASLLSTQTAFFSVVFCCSFSCYQLTAETCDSLMCTQQHACFERDFLLSSWSSVYAHSMRFVCVCIYFSLLLLLLLCCCVLCTHSVALLFMLIK